MKKDNFILAMFKAILTFLAIVIAIAIVANYYEFKSIISDKIEDHMKIRFEKCIGDTPSDAVCDSCYQLIFKNDLINHYK